MLQFICKLLDIIIGMRVEVYWFMKYLFVTLGILAMWISVLLIVIALGYDKITLPIIALVMTVILFFIGFGGKK